MCCTEWSFQINNFETSENGIHTQMPPRSMEDFDDQWQGLFMASHDHPWLVVCWNRCNENVQPQLDLIQTERISILAGGQDQEEEVRSRSYQVNGEEVDQQAHGGWPNNIIQVSVAGGVLTWRKNYTVLVQISRTRSWAGGGQHEQDAVLQDLQEDQRMTVHMGRWQQWRWHWLTWEYSYESSELQYFGY